MRGFRYFWDRRKVVKRALRNLAAWTVREPFRPKGVKGETVIIFVCENARARIFNVAYPLRKNERIRTILFSRIFEYEFQKKAFDEIHFFLNYNDLRKQVERISRKYNIFAVIGSTEPVRQSRVMLDMKRNWPVLIDQFDSIWSSTYFAGIDPAADDVCRHFAPEVREEEYCFRKADGVVARTGELPLLFQELNIDTPTLLYEDGCNALYFYPIVPRTGPKKGEWSVVYPGIFFPMNFDKRLFGSAQLVPFGKLFAQEKIHFHLYPSPIHDYQYPEYEAEAALNPYFHIHKSVDFDKVHHEISQYDFGWYANDYLQHGLTSEVYRKYAVATKFCTYLEAGLPVISNGLHVRSEDIISETGAGIMVRLDAPRGLRQVIEAEDLGRLLQGVERARTEMDVNHRSGQLLDFLTKVRERYLKCRQSQRA